MESIVKNPRNLLSNLRLFTISRSVTALCALLLLPLICSGVQNKAVAGQLKAKRAGVGPDLPSGYFSGLIHYFADNGNGSGTYSDGSLPTQVPLGVVSSVTDSKGNVYIAVSGAAMYMVYAGGPVPQVLANVTTTPVAGRIYLITGPGFQCPVTSPCDEGLPLNQVNFGQSFGLAVDSHDNLYYSDQVNFVVRKVDAATSDVTTVAGTFGTGQAGVPPSGGPATSTTMTPGDIRLDQWGNLYINDVYDDLVFVVYSGTQPPPVLAAENITVGPGDLNNAYIVIGATGFCQTSGSCGDGGPAVSATMYYQWSIAVDAAGNIYIADAAPDANTSLPPDPYIRIIYVGGAVPSLLNLTLAANGGPNQALVSGDVYAVTGYNLNPQSTPCAAATCGDGGLAGSVAFGGPSGSNSLYLAVDGTGNVYVSDASAHAVRKLDTSGYASTVAGIDDPNQLPSATIPDADGGPALGTYLNSPGYISFDPQNNLYIADPNLLWKADAKLQQTITFAPLSTVSYGTGPIALTATASSTLTVQYSVSTTPSGIAHLNGTEVVVTGAGSVSVTASQPGDNVYLAAAPVTQSFTVTQAQLTVTANPASRAFGQPNPAFTATITGFVNGDTVNTPGVIFGAPAFATSATLSSPQGTYPIIPSPGTLTSANYTFPPANFVPGVLTVIGSTPQTITFPPFSPSTVTFGQAPITLNATASSGGPVTLSCVSGPCQLSGPNNSSLTITGAGTIVVQATQNGYLQFLPATPVAQSLTVDPAILTVTGPTVTVAVGTTINPAKLPQPTITGFVGADTQSTVLTGKVAYSIPSGTLGIGTYPIDVSLGTLALVPAAAANYTFAPPLNGTLIVAVSGVPADSPSGFFPGLIHYFAGEGTTATGTYADGSVPTQVPIIPLSTATDSRGNTYIAGSGGVIYMVYAGGPIPAMLANVTTSAVPAVTPVAGRIYQIGGTGTGCGECAGLPLNQVVLGAPFGMVLDSQDNLYFADQTYAVVRKVDAATSNVSTVAGTWNTPTSSSTGDGGAATSGFLSLPTDIRLDRWGNLYIDDYGDDLVRVVYSGTQPPPVLAAEGITVGAPQANFIYSVGGGFFLFCTTGQATCGDGGPATSAQFNYQSSIAVDTAGNVYIADAVSDSSGAVYPYIRIIYAGGQVPPLVNLYLNQNGGSNVTPTAGYIYPATGYGITTLFGQCTAPGCGDKGLASNVQFAVNGNGSTNQIITLDSLGNLYVSDKYSYSVRKLDVSGYASTIAGIDDPIQTPPAAIPVPDGGLAVGTFLSTPGYIQFDSKNNLYITDNDLVWQVNPLLPQTITLPDFATVTYGVAPIALAGTASSGLPVQYAVTSIPTGIAHVNGSDLVITGAGAVFVTASQAGDNTYLAATSVTKSFTVNQAPLTVAADQATKVYGQPNPAFTATITGFVNGDKAQTPGAFSGAPTFSTSATVTSPQGTYTVTPFPGTLTSANYSFPPANFFPGILTVTGSTPQTITFPPFSPSTVTYGQGPLTLNATASSGGPVTLLCVSGPCQLSGPNGSILTITGAGTIVVKAIQNGYLQYIAAQPVTQTLVVNPAVLTVAGPTVTITYGTPLNPATLPPATISGFVGADTQNTVLTGTAGYSIPSGKPDAGTYPIVVSLGTLALLPAVAQNYTFAAPVNGTLVVNPASQVINFNPIPAGQTYGQFINLTALATSGLPVTFSATGPFIYYNNVNSDLELNGVGTLTVTATQPGNGNYLAATPLIQTLNVAPALLNITANNLVREQGAPNPTLTFTVGCPPGVPGCWVLSDTDIPSVITGLPDLATSATDASVPGTYPIIISQGTLASPNYSLVFINGTLTVTPPGSITITANPATLTIPRGHSGQSTITITPLNNYQGTVSMSCGQLPANVSCVVSPATFTFPGSQNPDGSENAAHGTITINTAAGNVVGALQKRDSNLLEAGFILPGALAGLVLLFVRRRAERWLDAFRTCALMILGLSLFGLISCGGGSGFKTAAPGTITLTINGSGTTPSGNNSVAASVPLTVIIQ